MRSMNRLIKVKTVQGIMHEKRHRRRAQMENARLCSGFGYSITGSVYRAKDGEYRLVKLEARYEERPLPEVSVVDLREELKKGNRSL